MARKQEEIPTCNHVKPSGNTCESPALKDDEYCYFHRLQRERIKRQLRNARKQQPVELPPIEDLESIHIAIGDVLNALIADRIDHKKAGLLLYGLQTAATTIRHCRFATNEYRMRMVRYTDRERLTLEEEVNEEIKREEAAERRAAARAAKKAGCSTAGDVPDVGVSSDEVLYPVACPTAGSAPDVGDVAADSGQPPTETNSAHHLPEKKPATGISNQQFWDVVGERARQNAKEVAEKAMRRLAADDEAPSARRKKTS